MITGDNPLTALSVAKECGIYDKKREDFLLLNVDNPDTEEINFHHLDKH